MKLPFSMFFLRREMFEPFISASCFSRMRICMQRHLYSLSVKILSKSAKINTYVNLFCIIHMYICIYIYVDTFTKIDTFSLWVFLEGIRF